MPKHSLKPLRPEVYRDPRLRSALKELLAEYRRLGIGLKEGREILSQVMVREEYDRCGVKAETARRLGITVMSVVPYLKGAERRLKDLPE